MKILILALLLIFISNSALGAVDKMNLHHHSMVIEKLERALPLVKDQTLKRSHLIGRLGDLYAERARLKFISEVEKPCNNCLGSQNDRHKAISYYEQLLSDRQQKNRTHAIFQLAHLYKSVGQLRKAKNLYKVIIANKQKLYSHSLVGAAHFDLAEIHYAEKKFKTALNGYQKSLKTPDIKNKGLIHYRIAWCQFNTGHLQLAKESLITILKSPNLLMTHGSSEIDVIFHKDVARDLTSFLARDSIRPSEINSLVMLSPEETRKENVFSLGAEAQRLGKKHEALLVWKTFLASEHPTQEERLEISLAMAELYYDLESIKKSVEFYSQTLDGWNKGWCQQETKCENLQKRLRNFVVNWSKKKYKTLDPQLLHAFMLYANTFKSDMEIHMWTAHLALKLKNLNAATEFYIRTAQLAKNKSDAHSLEGALLGEIEAAEQTQNTTMQIKAYDHYLAELPQGKKVHEVKYLKAKALYEQKNYKAAADIFTSVALTPSVDTDMRLKSADLAIDSLALLKDNQTMEILSRQFAQTFPQRSQEYLSNSRKASLKISAAVLASDRESNSDLRKEEERLQKLNMMGATSSERIKILKTRLALAQKLQNLTQISIIATMLLKEKELNANDENYAKELLAWSEEMRLNFPEALKLTKELNPNHLSREDKFLRLAILSELAGKDATTYYRSYIKATPSRRKANAIRAKLIKMAKQPWTELNSELSKLRKTPDILAQLALDVYSLRPNLKKARNILKERRIRNYPEGQVLARIVFISEYSPVRSALKRHKLHSRSQYLINKTTKSRLKLISDVERYANRAIASKDWVLQLLTLDFLKGQYLRLHDELHQIPVPKNLNKKQKAQYKALLAQQTKGYKDKAESIDRKTSTFWRNDQALAALLANYQESPLKRQHVLKGELDLLANLAPSYIRSEIEKTLNTKGHIPNRQELRMAWANLKEDPLDIEKNRKLQKLLERRGSDTLVAYFDSRVDSIKTGVKK